MKEIFTAVAALTMTGAYCAQNLIVNGDMSDAAKFSAECRSDGGKTGALSLFSEDITWNKCGRLEVVATQKSESGTDIINANAWIGRNDSGSLPGFFVKPNTTYTFSIDLKGTPRRVRVAARTWIGDDLWQGAELRLTTVSMTKISREWATYTGTFKTGPSDVRAALCVQMWCDTKYPKSQQYKVGDWVLFDNVSVSDRQGDIKGFAERYGKPIAVAPVPVTTDMRVPFVPEEVLTPPEKIEVKAAVNELKGVPIALANLTGELAEYRVSLETADKAGELTKFDGSFGLSGFPPERITVRKGLRFKDNDLYHGKLRIDPLVKMDEASSVTVPAMECALVWFDFDTTGVKPGKYKGKLRVISLTETGKTIKNPGGGYGDVVLDCPGILDVPFVLEVLPIELPRDPVSPGNLYSLPANRSMFRQMTALGCRDFLVSPWAFAFARDENGSFDPARYKPQPWPGGDVRKVLRDLLTWAKEDGRDVRFLLGYSVWTTFKRVYGTPGDNDKTMRDWKSWLKAVKAVMNANGASDDCYWAELQDEPPRADIPVLIEALKAAKEVVPDMQFTVTFLGGNDPASVDELKLFEPYLDGYIFHDLVFLRNPGYHGYIAELVKKGKYVSHYTCSTRMTEDLDREFRQNAWLSERWGLNGNAIYQAVDGMGGAGALNWKLTQRGGLLYRAGNEFMPSVRAMAMRQGVQDVKYLDVLRKKSGGCAKIAEFLREAAVTVTENPAGGDRRIPDRMREKAAELILGIGGKERGMAD